MIESYITGNKFEDISVGSTNKYSTGNNYSEYRKQYIDQRDKVFTQLTEKFPQYNTDCQDIEELYSHTNNFINTLDKFHEQTNTAQGKILGINNTLSVRLAEAIKDLGNISNNIELISHQATNLDPYNTTKKLIEQHACDISATIDNIYDNSKAHVDRIHRKTPSGTTILH